MLTDYKNLNFDYSFASIFSRQHADERIWHFFKTFNDGFSNFDLSLKYEMVLECIYKVQRIYTSAIHFDICESPSIQRSSQRCTRNPSIFSCLKTNVPSAHGAVVGSPVLSLYVEIAPHTDILPKSFI